MIRDSLARIFIAIILCVVPLLRLLLDVDLFGPDAGGLESLELFRVLNHIKT